MKYCKDCKHIKENYSKPKCLKSGVTTVTEDPVYGLTYEKPWFRSCFAFRRDNSQDTCGSSAMYWEPSFWFRVKRFFTNIFRGKNES